MSDAQFMRLALRPARGGYGAISPNPIVGAVLVKAAKSSDAAGIGVQALFEE